MSIPVAYIGSESYIFISYSHRDSEVVFPVITRLIQQGYRVWYDSGIDPGSEWDENIASHISNCGYFIAMMSENYLGSSNCKDELTYARDLEKDRLIVYLEDVQLPAGLAMRVNRLQSIFKYAYNDEETFYSKLFEAQNIEKCLNTDGAEVAPAPTYATAAPLKPSYAEAQSKQYQTQKDTIRQSELSVLNAAYQYFYQRKDLFELHDALNTLVKHYEEGAKSALLVWGIINAVIGTIILIAAGMAGVIYLGVSAMMIAGGILMKVNNRTKYSKYTKELSETVGQIQDLYSSYPNCPVGINFIYPNVLAQLIETIQSGRADTIKEAINLYLD